MASENQDVSVKENNIMKTDGIELFNKIFSWFLQFSVVAYVFGFIIVNTSFLRYGFMTYDATSPRFLAAGMLFLVACVFIGLAYAILRGIEPKIDRIYLYGQVVYYVSAGLSLVLQIPILRESSPGYTPVLSILGYFFIIIWITYFPRVKFEPIKLVVFQLCFYAACIPFFIFYCSRTFQHLILFIFLTVFLIYIFRYLIFNLGKEIYLLNTDSPFALALGLLAIISLPIVFGYLIYPKVDRMRGGGAPLHAALIMSTQQSDLLLTKFSDCRINLNNVSIIYETSDSIFLSIKNEFKKRVAVEILKKDLSGIKYFKN